MLGLLSDSRFPKLASGGRKASRRTPYRGGAVARIECPLTSLLNLGRDAFVCVTTHFFGRGLKV